MRNFIITLSFILISSNAISQNLILSDFDDKDISNDTVVYNGTQEESILEYGLKITNTSGTALDVKVLKQEISVVQGTENYFCWKECYEPSIFESPEAMTISAGEVIDKSFKSDYKPNSKTGVSKIRYKFFNTVDANDTVTIMVYFDVNVTAIDEPQYSGSQISNPYPIPAVQYVVIDYEGIRNGRIEIYSLSGQMLKEKKLVNDSGKIMLSSTELAPGVYIYKIMDAKSILKSGRIVFR